ncbi:uncharacterized protein LOC127000445 isoform X2 [Eriocheir sinensis]|uniref:uncharacterized protein LOC127000445 isoform X2 n=1 Tax=Eriocheir sinensis TaxID=95602 RepID=UPI0021C646DF|nr:uncharacterized protein LOC127000445 isoform X2 [Eriocheir sinensis]
MWPLRGGGGGVAGRFTLLLLSLLLCVHLSLALISSLDSIVDKVKQRIDLKLPMVFSSTTSRPPVIVYSRGGRGRARGSNAGLTRGRGNSRGRGGGWGVAGRGKEQDAGEARHAVASNVYTDPVYTPTHNVHTPTATVHTPPRGAQVTPTCPGPFGLYPHPQDCSKYITCNWGKGTVMSCGPGTLFNPAISNCDWPYAFTCSATPLHPPTPQPTPQPQFIPPGHRRKPQGRGGPPGQIGRNAVVGVNRNSPPGHNKTPPGQGGTPPGHGGTPPGHGGTPPRHGGTPPGQSGTPPGHGGSPPGHSDSSLGSISSLFGSLGHTYKRTKAKGKSLLKKYGLTDTAALCLRPDGVFAYPKDCAKFVNCWRGRPSLQPCAPGTLFNAAKGVCDFPSKTVCTKAKKSQPSAASVSYVVPPPSGQSIRLRGSDVPWAGYVQVSEGGGKWQMVADEEGRWTMAEASVVCRSLGFSRGAETVSQGAVFGLLPGYSAGVKAVVCQGHEEQLTECQLTTGTRENLERTVVGVQCVRNWVSECKVGGVRWGDKCYYVDTSSPPTTHAHARDGCVSKGARLLSITSQAENDFVSDLLSSLAGDTTGFHTGGVRTQVFDDVFWVWQNTSTLPTPDLAFSKWWPGWNVTDGRGTGGARTAAGGGSGGGGGVSGAAAVSGNKCVVLKDNFPITQGGEGGDAPAEYFFWQLTDCEEKLHFVCETEKLDVGCVLERGVNYTGAARVTGKGEACLPWDHHSLRLKVRDLLPHQPLLENYCTNPDGDDFPWCFTGQGRASVCDIPRCERQTMVEEECGADKFRCASGDCVNGVWYCDGHQDCEDGSDEVDCRDYSLGFSKSVNQKLTGREVEKWLYTLKTTCAARCVQAKNFVCMSFNYQQSSETCVLSGSTVSRSGGLEEAPGWEYYEMHTHAMDCTASFVCGDGLCLNSTQRCDGRRDCKEGEDEDGCQDDINFAVRLVNGSSPNEGRVEVRAFGRWGAVCDDMWGMLEGDVVCQSLGFHLGAREVFLNSYFGSGGLPYLMDDLNCKGNEATLAECDFAGWGEHDCRAAQEVSGVRCFTEGDECGRDQWRCNNGRCVEITFLCDTVDDCRDSSDEDRAMCESPMEVRLVGDEEPGRGASEGREGTAMTSGRVEVRYLGMWGTVCDDDFGFEEGHVLCRMMGWERAVHVYKNNTYGPGTGSIWLDDLRCIGYESSVEDCQHMPWGLSNCEHNEDVGLQCTNDTVPTDATDSSSLDPVGSSPELPAAGEGDPSPATPTEALPETCGRRVVEDNPMAPIMEKPKIVSGHTPLPGAHPWMVAIYLRTKTGPKQSCGGAVLSEDVVLTAAHCVVKYPPSTYILKIGDFNVEEEEEGQQEFRVSSIAIHPKFDKGPYLNNDVALLRIKRKNGRGIQFGRNVQPLCLVPSRWTYPSLLNCTVAGWGSLGIALGYSKVLQSALLPILPQSTCQADHVYGPTRLTEGMYCAGYLEGGVDTCQGDSGGPMVCLVEGRHTVVGITSWGHGCARPNKPGVYTKLTHYLSWLYSNLG